MLKSLSGGWLCALLASLGCGLFAGAAEYPSHPPMRPLPVPSRRPMSDGPAYFVDADNGDDQQDGSKSRPWRTVQFAVAQLAPGDTLYLRGGTYYERVDVPVSGEPDRPITIRSYPGELAILDGGLAEFHRAPATAWMPLEDGAAGEYVSARTYPQFAARPTPTSFPAAGWEPFYGKEDQRPVVLGNFGDSMVPLHGYRTLADLRDNSMLWDVDSKFAADEGVYCGPGLWYNRRTQRIHIRLAHTNLPGLGKLSYTGETDPRKLPLVISGPHGLEVLRLTGVNHVALADLVLRGASGNALLSLYGADDITLDGLTLFGGAPGLRAGATSNVRIVNSAFRSLAAPWSSRASMKYRGTPSYVLLTQRQHPENHDWEIAYSEFTDGHDGLWLRFVRNVRFHHNLLDNFNDDGLEFGARKRDQLVYVDHNRLSRCQLMLTLHEMEPDESPAQVDPGSGVYITRNVIDLRQGTFKGPPRTADATGGYLDNESTLSGDHGGPIWPNYFFYHNTVLRSSPSWRGYYGFGIGGRGTRGTTRRVVNNIFVQITGLPGLAFAGKAGSDDDIFVDGNLHWGVSDGPKLTEDFFQSRLRGTIYRGAGFPTGWMEHDQFADPQFRLLAADPAADADVRLQANSPAIDAGIAVPNEWYAPPDVTDAGAADVGAFAKGEKVWQVGVGGRYPVTGK